MGLQSLLDGWGDAKGKVSEVSGVQASIDAGFSDTPRQTAEVSRVSASAHTDHRDTPDTCTKQPGYQHKPAPALGRTLDTPDTRQFVRLQEPNAESTQTPASNRWCWPNSSAMNGGEIGTFTQRVARFTSRGLPLAKADTLAATLTQRDRDKDDRRLCLECAHMGRAGQCGNWRRAGLAKPAGLVQVLQRCGGLKG